MFTIVKRVVVFASLCVAVPVVAADNYPARVVRVIVPHGAGGGTDVVARVFAQKLATNLGKPVIVENKPGGGSQLGAEYVASSPADGYTVLFSSSSILTLPYTRKTKFELTRDFIPIGQVGVGSFVLVVNPKMAVNNVQQFIDKARTSPGTLTYGSAGVGSANHLGGELLNAKAGIRTLHVPFKSNNELSQALMAGQIDFAIDVLTTQKDQVAAKLVKGLATTGANRDPYLPDLPTLNESQAIPGGYELTYWFGVFVPAKTPAAIVDKLRREFVLAMRDPEVIRRVKGFSLIPSTFDADGFTKNISAETELWKRIIAEKGLDKLE